MPEFSSSIAEFLYKLAPDEECGETHGIGRHSLFLGDLGLDSPEFDQLPEKDQLQLEQAEAAILFEDEHHVEAVVFTSVDEALTIWEDIEDDDAESIESLSSEKERKF